MIEMATTIRITASILAVAADKLKHNQLMLILFRWSGLDRGGCGHVVSDPSSNPATDFNS